MLELDLDCFFTPIPSRLRRLRDLAYNLWWSWHPEAQDLYRQLDPDLWELVYHNPVRFLREVRQQRLDQAAGNPAYLQQFETILAAFEAYLRPSETWQTTKGSQFQHQTIAYFSAEFGLHEALPIYSGGLGILAGDQVKEASDMGLPLVAVGFLYPQGFFYQRLDAQGQQIAEYRKLSFVDEPILPARTPAGREVVVAVELAGRMVYAKVYRVQVGRVPLFLLDTDIHPNNEQNRQLLARIYSGEQELRLAQEVILGIGGVRALRQLGINPTIWHLNEGHAAFLVLELLREMILQGMELKKATEKIRKQVVFTTHSLNSSKLDLFPSDLIEKYFWRYWPQLDMSHEMFLNLARQDQSWGPAFSMAVLALRFARACNGVSKLHAHEARGLWHWLYPTKSRDEVPIQAITNGVHTVSWLAPELQQIYAAYLGFDWKADLDAAEQWQKVASIPNDVLWGIRQRLKHNLLLFVQQRLRQQAQRRGESSFNCPILDERALTIGFARRFVDYKRAKLIFQNPTLLKALLNDPARPVQIIFAGKAHPNDEVGKHLLQEIVQFTQQPGFERVFFLEDYDLNVARELVKGVDLWLNTPRKSFEASGTSGQKASLNGVPNLSMLAGWWPEAYNERNGWAIQAKWQDNDEKIQNHHDAQALYDLLQNIIIPIFYDKRDSSAIPNAWLEVCKEAIMTILPQFSSRRMLTEYVINFYLPICLEK